jgi:hypothetical protein
VDIITIKAKKHLARDRMINLRVSWKELALLKEEAIKKKKSLSDLIREGFLESLKKF